MKKGDVTNWFRFTTSGEMRWYKAKIRDWEYSDDVADVEIFRKMFDNCTMEDALGRCQIDKSEIWPTQKMLEHKNRLFRMIFTVISEKQQC